MTIVMGLDQCLRVEPELRAAVRCLWEARSIDTTQSRYRRQCGELMALIMDALIAGRDPYAILSEF
jgi:hypothetical protein